MPVRLDKYRKGQLEVGAPRWAWALWYVVEYTVFRTALMPWSGWRVFLLRLFGAHIGKGVVIRHGVRVKFPWKLRVGNYVWIGEDVWIDNLAEVHIEDHVCISQGAYLCTGSHDYTSPTFELVVGAIRIEKGAWVGARAIVLPGTVVGEGVIVGAGAVVSGSLQPYTVYRGNPASATGIRVMRDE